jgi:hypothetical protein
MKNNNDNNNNNNENFKISKNGNSAILIIVNFNPNWINIDLIKNDKDKIFELFINKLNYLLTNINNKFYFGEVFLLLKQLNIFHNKYTNLPYAHLNYKVNIENKLFSNENIIKFIDQWICAELPDEKKEPFLFAKVNTYMIHHCTLNCNQYENKISCNYNFNIVNKLTVQKTYFDEKNIVYYRKKREIDIKVIPYHKQMLIDWDGYININFIKNNYLSF